MKKENVAEILYTDECPFWKKTLKLIDEAIADLKANVTVKKVKIENERDAKKLKFPGSPTVRVNGVDIDPATKETAGYIGCRIYRYEGVTYEFPPRQMIKLGFERLLRK